MNILLKNKVKWFLRYADEKSQHIVKDLLKEIDRIETARNNDATIYRRKLDESIREMYHWQDLFYEHFYPEEKRIDDKNNN